MHEGELTIELPGVPVEIRSRVEEQIRFIVERIATVLEQKTFPSMPTLILVSDSFQDDVNRYLRERAGPSGYVAQRESVHAIARTLWVRSDEGMLRFVIVIDAKQGNPWSPENLQCLITVLHEILHVPQEVRRLEMLGEEEYTAGNDTAQRMLNRNANLLIDEYDVDRRVDALLRLFVTDGNGQPLSLRELKEDEGEDWAQALLDSLDRMPQVVDESVNQVLSGQKGVQYLADTVIPYVFDLLVQVSHTAALYMGTDRWDRIMDSIGKTEASERFLKQHLASILSRLADGQAALADSVHVVANAMEGIYENCGLHFPEYSGGLYIDPSPPSR